MGREIQQSGRLGAGATKLHCWETSWCRCCSVTALRAAQKWVSTKGLQLLYNITRTSVKCISFPAPADASSTCISGASTLPTSTQNTQLQTQNPRPRQWLIPFPVTGGSGFLWAYGDLKNIFIWFVLCMARKSFLGKAHHALSSECTQIWAWFFWSSLV